MSTLVPKELTQKGCLGNASWLAGIVVRIRVRTAGGGSNAASKSTKGKGRKYSKTHNTDGFEFHLCGGSTPADVMMVEVWDPEAIDRVKRKATVGSAVKITNIELVQHNEKTTPWTTSRLTLYARFARNSLIEDTETLPEWLSYHPLTPLKSLQHVPEGRLVCVAAKLLPPVIQITEESIGSEKLPIAKFQLRAGSDMVNCTAWREAAQKPKDFEVGDVMFLEAVKKVKSKHGIELRYISITDQRDCPPEVEADVKEKTQSDTADGAHAWTKPVSRKRNYTEEEATWLSLSVCAKFLEGDYCPSSSLAHCPSVLISSSAAALTYSSCADCPKGLQDGAKTCSCHLLRHAHDGDAT